MISRWTQHLKTEKDKQDFERFLLSSKTILNRLKDILTESEQSIDRSETSEKIYENPNWAFLQAHKNGYRQCISHIQRLLTLDPQKEYNDPITNG